MLTPVPGGGNVRSFRRTSSANHNSLRNVSCGHGNETRCPPTAPRSHYCPRTARQGKGVHREQDLDSHPHCSQHSGHRTAAAGSETFEIERHGTRVFVKPTKPDVATNLFVWTEHGRSIYELQPAGEVSK